MKMADEQTGLHNRKVRTSSKTHNKTVDYESSDEKSSLHGNESLHLKHKEGSFYKNNYALIGFVIISVLSITSRLWKIWSPGQVVFDEVHFGKFSSYYLRREYYFDVHPPLAKMILAIPGWLIGYDGKFLFDKIGMDFTENGAPYFIMRSLVAMFGSGIPILTYMIMAESGYSLAVTFATAFMITFDNSLVLHSRLILLDSIMLFFIVGSVYSYIRFYKLRFQPFTTQWYTWLFSTGIFLGCSFSCKLVGLFTYMSVGVLVIIDLWNILDIKKGNSMQQFVKHFSTRFVALITTPFLLYLSFFYIHFAILTKTGPGDSYHTPNFQMQLAGNRLTINTSVVNFGDAVSLKHLDTSAFLHGRLDRYPRKYDDGRIGSNGHQVTGSMNLDSGSYWIIAPVDLSENIMTLFNETGQLKEDSVISNDIAPYLRVRNRALVRLIHRDTLKVLRTHDVASPLTATNMEFTMIDYNNTADYKDTLFYLDFDQPQEKKTGPNGELLEDELRTISKRIHIISKSQNVGLLTNQKLLPDWGFGDHEINGDKNPKGPGTLWTINSVFGKTSTGDEEKIVIPKFSFLQKFMELQKVMLEQNAKLIKPHPYQSTPESWPLMKRGISFWVNSKKNQQIYFVANPFGWVLALIGLISISGFYLYVSGCHQRQMTIIPYMKERHIARNGLVMVGLYFAHYLPFFSMGRALFIHHYLPALIFEYMALGAALQLITVSDYSKFALFSPIFTRANLPVIPQSRMALFGILAIIFMQFVTFIYFSPFVYGSPLSRDQTLSRKWISTWDFTVPKA
ncbi:Dolichyl-phosphate-mannose-protein mannosyltransferase 4 [Smittium mucronatum]|uniref:Dolichyl-phosphate-mannose--protein mannosyltransferase n=1 Tax=Smittium mucronatum TaxID=133383 RepID=A0A1R0GSH7_9FUNG|nr:Dolichyl-phosphate-mannose-protein mannosyltransferase 4 [Smittium mucronatum]